MPTTYNREKVDQMLSEWSEEASDIVSLEDLKQDKELPTPIAIERHYPSARDAVVANNMVYQRRNWTTTFGLDEEEYPKHTEISGQRDIYAAYIESEEELGYGEIVDLLGTKFSKVAEILGPLKHPDPVQSLD